MTREERNNKLKQFITCLKCEVSGKPCDGNCSKNYEVGNMGEIIENLEAISKALEQEPFINKPCVSSGVCEHDKQMVLDKIRAEIDNALSDGMIHKKTVLGIIDKYKSEEWVNFANELLPIIDETESEDT